MQNGGNCPPKFPPHYLEQLIENSPDIVVAVDRFGTIVYYNDGAEKTLGYAAGEILGKKVTDIYVSAAEAKRVMAAMRGDEVGGPGKVKNFETIFVDRWGQRMPVAISGSILSDDDGFEIGSIGFAKDLREIRRRDRLATLGEVAVAVCHEVNNPLAAIMNQVEILDTHLREAATESGGTPPEEQRLKDIRRELEKIQKAVGKLEAFSHGEEYETREYNRGTKMAALSAPPEAGALSGLRILVVDDDMAVSHSVRDLLIEEGCEVVTAHGGLEALRLFDRLPFDVVISDVVMPDLDGYDLYMEIKRRGSTTPVLLMTGYYYDRDHVIKRSRLEGLEQVLFKKPVNPERLKGLIRGLCRKPGASAQPSV